MLEPLTVLGALVGGYVNKVRVGGGAVQGVLWYSLGGSCFPKSNFVSAAVTTNHTQVQPPWLTTLLLGVLLLALTGAVARKAHQQLRAERALRVSTHPPSTGMSPVLVCVMCWCV